MTTFRNRKPGYGDEKMLSRSFFLHGWRKNGGIRK
jgi:hypothetical protein